MHLCVLPVLEMQLWELHALQHCKYVVTASSLQHSWVRTVAAAVRMYTGCSSCCQPDRGFSLAGPGNTLTAADSARQHSLVQLHHSTAHTHCSRVCLSDVKSTAGSQ
jgi:hypothetical protein